MTPFLRFMSLMIGIDLAGFLLAGLLFPANRTGQLMIAVPTLTISPVIAFGVVYGFDPAALTNPFGMNDANETAENDAVDADTRTGDERGRTVDSNTGAGRKTSGGEDTTAETDERQSDRE